MHGRTNGISRWILPCLLCALVLLVAAPPAAAEGVDAETAFERLKSLQGTWTGMPESTGHEEAEPEEPHELTLVFEVSAAGNVVMETMAPDTDHEMINMYHLDGDDLLVTHYCSSGNQPRMKLDRTASSDDVLVFDFLDATNLDPEHQAHIHGLRLEMEDGALKSEWSSYANGEPAGVMSVELARAN